MPYFFSCRSHKTPSLLCILAIRRSLLNNAVLLLLLLLYALPSHGAGSVLVKGLFKNKAAVLVIDGEQSVVKVGATTGGVTLVSTTSREAVVLIDGEQRTLSLSKQIGASYKKPTTRTVRIASQKGGHYWVQGQINGLSVRFVVDTGATSIALNQLTAKRLGIQYEDGDIVHAATANGVAEARKVLLPKVTIGPITQYQVEALVMPDDSLPTVLLGNSFLRHVEMRTDNGVLILEGK